MFKKLLSNLPYNPSLIGQVSFYAKRLHNETAVRRTGFIMIFLAMMIQSFAVFSPPEASLQASSNTDLLNGGFSKKDEAVDACRDNKQDFKEILANFGISCDNVADAYIEHISPTDHDKKLYSMGRMAFGVDGERSIRIDDVGKFYVRHFYTLNHKSSYKALKVKNSEGKTFYILYDCGNLVSIGIPKEVEPPKKCPYNSNLLATDRRCFEPCPVKGKTHLPKTSSDCFEPCPYNKSIKANSPKCFDPCPVKGKQNIPKTSAECFEPCPYNSTVPKDSPKCRPCEESQTRNDLTACLDYRKTAKNLTQGVADANGSTANPGDIIEYTLRTKNTGKATITHYQVSEEIGDVLDYADITDLHGGTKGAYDVVTWPHKDMRPGQELVNKITIKVKDVLPNTPISSSDINHFDMVMTNVYGNTVNIKLPASVSKQVEIATTTLPNTGPGTSLAIGFSLTVFIAYFFARSRLLAKELDVVRSDFASVGGY